MDMCNSKIFIRKQEELETNGLRIQLKNLEKDEEGKAGRAQKEEKCAAARIWAGKQHHTA